MSNPSGSEACCNNGRKIIHPNLKSTWFEWLQIGFPGVKILKSLIHHFFFIKACANPSLTTSPQYATLVVGCWSNVDAISAFRHFLPSQTQWVLQLWNSFQICPGLASWVQSCSRRAAYGYHMQFPKSAERPSGPCPWSLVTLATSFPTPVWDISHPTSAAPSHDSRL